MDRHEVTSADGKGEEGGLLPSLPETADEAFLQAPALASDGGGSRGRVLLLLSLPTWAVWAAVEGDVGRGGQSAGLSG